MDNGIDSLSCVGDAGHIREVTSNDREARAIQLGRARLRAGDPDDFLAAPLQMASHGAPNQPRPEAARKRLLADHRDDLEHEEMAILMAELDLEEQQIRVAMGER